MAITIGNYYASSGTSTVSAADPVPESVWTKHYQSDVVKVKQKKVVDEEKPMEKRRVGYQVGARVVVIRNPGDHKELYGRAATVMYSSLPSLCLEFDEPITGGHRGTDHRGREYSCWNIDMAYVKPISGKAVQTVIKDFEVAGKNMKGEEVKVLATFTSGKVSFSLVEFKENVGGHSGDGLGKKGHCWSLPTRILKMATKKEKVEKKGD